MQWKNSKSQWTQEFSSRDDVIYKNRHPPAEAETWVNSTLHAILNCMDLQCVLLIVWEKSLYALNSLMIYISMSIYAL